MTPNSRTALVEQDTLESRLYSTSETSEEVHSWIQFSITHLTLNPSASLLIDGIYAQTSTQEAVSATKDQLQAEIEAQLAAMAADPDIQREIRLIEEEFAGTELDGLSDE